MTAFGCDWEVTVVQIWANFCLLCRQEHPALEDFFENPCGADSPQALTFNTGDDVSKVASYMREKYKFPADFREDLREPIDEALYSERRAVRSEKVRRYVSTSRCGVRNPRRSAASHWHKYACYAS